MGKGTTYAVALAAVTGCSFAGNESFQGGATAAPDAEAAAGADAGADAAMATGPTHLLLSEVKTAVTGEEFVEIVNPLEEAQPLAGYYLSDVAGYYELPGAFGGSGAPDVPMSDFLVAFPPDVEIEAGAAIVVAIDGEGFQAAFGSAPDFAVRTPGDAEPMAPAFDGSVGSLAGLTDSGELVTLFYWDGEADQVRDADMIHAGADTSAGNLLRDKSGRGVDGPDEGPAMSHYPPEAASLGQMSRPAEPSQTYTRIELEGEYELRGKGKSGLTGDDETSEDLGHTWTVAEPTPGVAGL